ncbi:MAG: ABC transporter substrate-binding protein, partial [Bacillota bacterium]|nr:ABC transporter substrate-binding protein [Bacillota bacterium]
SGFDASTLTANALLERWQTGHKKNMISFSSEMYDSLMAQANAATDEDVRTGAFMAAAEVLTKEAANVYIQDLAEFTAINKALAGFEFYPLYKLDFSTIYYVD